MELNELERNDMVFEIINSAKEKGKIRLAHIPKLVVNAVQRQRIEKWIFMLRSGEYDQGQGFLRDSLPSPDCNKSAYCCLGVAGDLLVKEGLAHWVINRIPNSSPVYKLSIGGVSNRGKLPPTTEPLLGIKGVGLEVAFVDKDITLGINYLNSNDISVVWVTLATLNDAVFATFAHIADILEVSLKGGYTRHFEDANSATTFRKILEYKKDYFIPENYSF